MISGGPLVYSGQMLSPIGLYQRYVSREFNEARGRCCRYTPTCSQYARDAIASHGLREGSEMAFMRFLRCSNGGPAGGTDEVAGAHHHDCGQRVPAFYARKDSSRGVLLAAGAAQVAGKLLGALSGGLAGALGGACLGGYLGARAGQGPEAMGAFHARVTARHGAESLQGLERIERVPCAVGRLSWRLGWAGVAAGALGGAVTGALGGALTVGKLGWEMGGYLGRNLTLDRLEGSRSGN